MTAYLGQLAALGTSMCWSATSLLFSGAGRRVGSMVVNRTRLLFALVLVTLIHLVTRGQILPFDAEPFRWGWLALSGVVGFVLGDAFLFQAFVLIGPRLSMLLMALAPVFSTLMGFLFLGETLVARELAGIALTVGGVALVLTERGPDPASEETPAPKHPLSGILFGLGGALGQATGLIASKLGLVGNFPPLSANLMRLLAAALTIWLYTLIRRQVRPTIGRLRAEPRAAGLVFGGTLAGPVLGVTLSLIAVQRAPVGIASTLMSLPPVILLPVDRLFFGMHVGLRAIVGTALAFAGTALLFLQF